MLSKDVCFAFAVATNELITKCHLRKEKNRNEDKKKPQLDKDSYFGDNVHWVHAQNNDHVEWTFSLIFLPFRKFICTSFQYKHRL